MKTSSVSVNPPSFVPLEAPYLSLEANEQLDCSEVKSEGITLKKDHAILPLEDRLATYSLDDSVGISGLSFLITFNLCNE